MQINLGGPTRLENRTSVHRKVFERVDRPVRVREKRVRDRVGGGRSGPAADVDEPVAVEVAVAPESKHDLVVRAFDM